MITNLDVLHKIQETLEADYELFKSAAIGAHEAATDDENIPDNKYDTLSLEASYVAQGQANRAQEIRMILNIYQNLKLQCFDDDTPIGMAALVTLVEESSSEESEEMILFIGPAAGGTKIMIHHKAVTVITPESPLGKKLIGQHFGDSITLKVGNRQKSYEILGQPF